MKKKIIIEREKGDKASIRLKGEWETVEVLDALLSGLIRVIEQVSENNGAVGTLLKNIAIDVIQKDLPEVDHE